MPRDRNRSPRIAPRALRWGSTRPALTRRIDARASVRAAFCQLGTLTIASMLPGVERKYHQSDAASRCRRARFKLGYVTHPQDRARSRSARMVGALRVRRDVLRGEKYVAKATVDIAFGLIDKMARFRMAALAAAHDRLGPDRHAEFDGRHEAVAR